MKKAFILLCLCVFITVVGADSLTGFWGIPFGSSTYDTEAILVSKGLRNVIRRKDGDGNYLFAAGTSFAGRTADITFYFFKNQLYMSFVNFTKDMYDLFDEYKALKNDLISKYGTPGSDVEEYKYPYKKGDGDEIMAVRMNAASIYSVWNFDSKNAILLTARYDKESDKYQILLSYRYGILYEQKKQANNAIDDL
jgi:hypothetical protein